MRLSAFLLAATCGFGPKFPGTYRLVGQAEPGEHQAGPVPPGLRGTTLILREDRSATMRTPGVADQEAEYTTTADSGAVIVTSDGPFILRARFSHDTLVTRVPGGGPAFYWIRQ